MKRSIRWRIAVPYVLLILLLMVLALFYLSNLVRDVYLDSQRRQLEAECRVIADAIRSSLTQHSPSALDPLAYRYARLVDARVTVIAADGTVLGESHRSSVDMENHLGRPEIQQALSEGRGSSVRYSETIRYDMLYVAVLVEGEGGPVGFVRLAVPLSRVEERVAGLRQTLLLAWLLVTLLSVVLASLIAERTAHPIRRLTAVARRLAEGDLNARLYVSTEDEIGQLTRAFNEMADRLRTQVHTLAEEQSRLAAVLESAASGIVITDAEGEVRLMNPAAAQLLDTTAERALGRSFAQAVRYHQLIELWQECRREQQEQSGVIEISLQGLFVQAIVKPFQQGDMPGYLVLLQDLTRIRRLETVRRDFISNISHELRTPLAGLKALVETLEEGALDDPPAARHFIKRMEVEVDALTQVVAELLELSRIESGKIPLRLRPVSWTELVLPAVERLQPQAERAMLEIVVEPADAPPVLADAERVQQVVTNLVHNAIKFTPPGGTIRITGRAFSAGPDELPVPAPLPPGEWFVLAVQDDGVGIDPDDLPRIFERFFKADRARSGGGTGLGLAIAKHIVQGHGGQIWAESPSRHPFWKEEAPMSGKDGRRRGSTFYFCLPVVRDSDV